MSNRAMGWSVGRLAAAVGVTLAMAVAAVSCGDSADDAADQGSGAVPVGTGDAPAGASAERGEELSRSSGCAGCHGPDFGGGPGPTWIGLAGSEVTLTDGRTLVADDAYLVRAIADPSADLVDGYNLKMPANNLSDADIADIVAYIRTLADG